MEALGVRFVPDDHELLEYLRHYDGGQTLHSFGFINQYIDPYGCRPEQLQNVSEKVPNYYYANREGRQTADGSGKWKSTDTKEPILKIDQIVGYKRNLRFYCEGTRSTKWVMTEYTLHHNTSHDAPKAICVIRNTAGNRRNETGQASNSDATNQPPPGSQPCMGSSSHTNVRAILMSLAADLGVDCELPPEFIMD